MWTRTDRGICVIAVVAVVWVAAVGGCTFDESLLEIRCTEAGAQRNGKVCRDGFWVEPSEVGTVDSGGRDKGTGCTDGERRTTSRSCGTSDQGSWVQVCREGRWVDLECKGGWYRSCEALRKARPGAETGTYELDIDGPGEREPTEYFCKIGEYGWTLVARDGFEEDAEGWSVPERTTCGDWGAILGGACTFGSGEVSRTYSIPPVPHTHARLALDYLKIDSWDREAGDQGWVSFAHETAWSSRLSGGEGEQQCGRAGFFSNDERIEVRKTVETGGRETYPVRAGASLDEDPCNESWGLDNVEIYVR